GGVAGATGSARHSALAGRGWGDGAPVEHVSGWKPCLAGIFGVRTLDRDGRRYGPRRASLRGIFDVPGLCLRDRHAGCDCRHAVVRSVPRLRFAAVAAPVLRLLLDAAALPPELLDVS